MLHEDDQWGPQPAAEAMKADLETAENAALSRLHPAQDGEDQWGVHRSSSITGSGGPAPEYVPEMFEPTWEGLYTKNFQLAVL
jgi:hypothetical protein